MTNPTASRYHPVSIGLHWLLALLIIGTLGVGLYMSDLPFSPSRLKLYNWHKWAGATVLALSVLRLAWRLVQRPPALPSAITASMPGWQRAAHHGTHVLLYVLFFAVPLTGWAYSSAAGFPIVWFGVLPLPDFVGPDKALAEAIKPLHGLTANALLALVALHVAAALKHHWIDRDGLMQRMGVGRAR